MDIERISNNLEKENGIYFSQSDSNISYPDDANANCMQIEENSFWFNHRNDVIVEVVKKYRSGKDFFDIGGGNGFVSKRLQKEGIKTAVLEPGLTGAKNSKKREIQTVICSTFENARFKKSIIEAIGHFYVIEHIENDQHFLNRIYESLKPGGFVYITVSAYKFLLSKSDKIAGDYRRFMLQHLHDLLRRSYFQMESSTYFIYNSTFTNFLPPGTSKQV
ncbi:MAG: methyltransferase domain-containing protein [Balneolaceae bacterium]|nr:methyltransferase domain-containing protein [Balneolaceae bacterium]MDR9410418.1 methyltransferase domain-containing protein [Balneolaceae bacterium]